MEEVSRIYTLRKKLFEFMCLAAYFRKEKKKKKKNSEVGNALAAEERETEPA